MAKEPSEKPNKPKNQLDAFEENVSTPLYLSLPFYCAAVFLALGGAFFLIHHALFAALPESGTGFFAVARKTFGPLDTMDAVRWKYYIPKSVFGSGLFEGAAVAGLGFLLIFFNKIGVVAYAKKRTDDAVAKRKPI